MKPWDLSKGPRTLGSPGRGVPVHQRADLTLNVSGSENSVIPAPHNAACSVEGRREDKKNIPWCAVDQTQCLAIYEILYHS